jgi:DNA-binding MarR family transcriptional regulator
METIIPTVSGAGPHGKMVSVKTKSGTVGEISRLVEALSDKFETDVDAEREYLAVRLPERLEGAVRELPTLSVHLLAAIADGGGDGGSVNVVGLAAQAGQLKGTVSKHVQRLVDTGLVARDPVPGNRKEIRLSLTLDGRRVVDVHRQMHQEITGGIEEFLLRYTAAELAVMVKVLSDLLHAEKRGVRIIAPG